MVWKSAGHVPILYPFRSFSHLHIRERRRDYHLADLGECSGGELETFLCHHSSDQLRTSKLGHAVSLNKPTDSLRFRYWARFAGIELDYPESAARVRAVSSREMDSI